ncbi:MAG: SLBB domain-containing protein [Kiritimatiellae bacterium]|nr:SLBB domain-containing protein [Kiritimatiellia bacterium]
MKRLPRVMVSLLLIALMAGGCSLTIRHRRSGLPTDDPARVAVKRRLRCGDRVQIEFYGVPGQNRFQDAIDDSGCVRLPLVKSVKIADMTTREAEVFVEQAYMQGGYYRTIDVSIVSLSAVAEVDQCFIRGEIKRPGALPLPVNMTLTQAIIAAGGFTEYANRRKVQVNRGDARVFYSIVRIEGGKDDDPLLRPGDKIIVHRHWM